MTVAGKGAEDWFGRLAKTVNREPRNATFAVVSGGVNVVPHLPGRELDVAASARALEEALFSVESAHFPSSPSASPSPSGRPT